MQHKLGNCLISIIAAFVVLCWGVSTQAEDSVTTKTPATTPASNATIKKAPASTGAATAKTVTANPGKVASVNGTVISQVQFDSALAYQQEIAAMNKMTITDEQMAELKYQLLQNLIGTALKFRGERPPEVHVSAQQKPGHWVIAVRDNGIVIEPQYFERIFLIFQRLLPKDQYDGSGIGLAISKRIVERHGGKIWVESQIGDGTTFYFTIAKNIRM